MSPNQPTAKPGQTGAARLSWFRFPVPSLAVTGPTIFVLALFLFAGNFLYAQAFGVYDDDFVATIPGFFWTGQETWRHMVDALVSWPQGRPIGIALNHGLSYLTGRSSTLSTGYAVGFCILLLNGMLLFKLANRFLPLAGSLFSSAIYLLYPIDTSKAILMYRVTNHLNVTFLLVALLAYVHGRRILAYCVASVCFLIYEPFFPIFLIAPLLVSSKSEFSPKRLLTHGALWLGIAGVLLYIRSRLGDPRIGESFHDVPETVGRILQALYIGPAMVAACFIRRPIEAIRYGDALQWMVAIFSGLGFYWHVARDRSCQGEPGPSAARERATCVMAAGAAGLLLGYALCFRQEYWPPIMTIGRFSGVHAAGSIGCALLGGGFLTWLDSWLGKSRPLLFAGAGLYCGLLVSFGIEVQRVDYLAHAEQQKRFWDQILETSNEWEPDTMILIDISGSDPGRPYTPGNQIWWTVNFAPTMLERLVEWPERWRQNGTGEAGQGNHSDRPRAYGFLPKFETVPDGDGVIVKSPTWLPPSYWPRIANGKFIYFRFAGGRMVRETHPVEIGGRTFAPMEHGLGAQILRKTRFYDMLFGRRTSWPSISNASNFPR